MHDYAVRLGQGQKLLVYLIVLEYAHGRLHGRIVAHRHPGVRIQDIRILAGLLRLMRCGDVASVLLRQPRRPQHYLCVGHPDGRAARDHIYPHYGARIQQGIADIVAVSQINELLAAEPPLLLFYRHHIRQGLARMLQVVQSAYHGHRRGVPYAIHDLVVVSAVHHPVDQPAEHTGRVLDRFVVAAHVCGGHLDVQRVASQLAHGHVEGYPGPGAGLLEYHRQGFALQRITVMPALLLKPYCQIHDLRHIVLHVQN